jgi:hypothetical protein
MAVHHFGVSQPARIAVSLVIDACPYLHESNLPKVNPSRDDGDASEVL